MTLMPVLRVAIPQAEKKLGYPMIKLKTPSESHQSQQKTLTDTSNRTGHQRLKALMQKTHLDKSEGLEHEFKQMQECSKMIKSGLPLPTPTTALP
jgi:hypothetical protein